MGRAHPGDGGWPDGPLLDPGGSAPEAGHSDGLESATPSTATPPAQGKNQRTSLGSVITVTRGATPPRGLETTDATALDSKDLGNSPATGAAKSGAVSADPDLQR